jgi:hypothetical protein
MRESLHEHRGHLSEKNRNLVREHLQCLIIIAPITKKTSATVIKHQKKRTPTKTYKLTNESKINVLDDCEQQVRTPNAIHVYERNKKVKLPVRLAPDRLAPDRLAPDKSWLLRSLPLKSTL